MMRGQGIPSETGGKFNIPPIAFIIAAVVVIAGCIIGICSVYSMYYEDESFKNSAGTADAVCTGKTVYTDGSDYAPVIHYVMTVQFNTEEDEKGQEYQTVLDETGEDFKNTDVGDTITIYYDRKNPTLCHPTVYYGDPTPAYIIFGIIIAAALIAAGINLRTLIRNIHGYTPVYTKPEDIGIMGDGTASGGQGDMNIDYNAADVYSDKLMDSLADPFTAYSGYDGEDEGALSEGQYFDPNSTYSGNESTEPTSNKLHEYENMDLNDPFTIYGDSSFGAVDSFTDNSQSE